MDPACHLRLRILIHTRHHTTNSGNGQSTRENQSTNLAGHSSTPKKFRTLHPSPIPYRGETQCPRIGERLRNRQRNLFPYLPSCRWSPKRDNETQLGRIKRAQTKRTRRKTEKVLLLVWRERAF